LLVALVVVVSSIEISPLRSSFASQWEAWKLENGKVYSSSEHDKRFEIFKDNLRFINEHNSANLGFTVAMNSFGDLTAKEFASQFNRVNITGTPGLTRSAVNPEVPDTWDWRTKGAVTGVKDQGQCGSCWSFSATGSTEGAWFLAKGQLVSLSEQNLVDCSTAEGNQGCNGGLMDSAFQYIIKNHGIDTEASYPYSATGPNSCKFKSNDVGATLSSFHDVSSGDENDLLNSVYKTPTSVAIDASRSSFQFYKSGVYYESSCSSSQLDHGVLAVGFGTDGGSAYWLVKNSWGSSWGDNGFIMMSRNRNNNCGIATAASYPIV